MSFTPVITDMSATIASVDPDGKGEWTVNLSHRTTRRAVLEAVDFILKQVEAKPSGFTASEIRRYYHDV
jgi:hypothetical protein